MRLFRSKQDRLPGLLLGMADGSSLERRVLRLLERRALWGRRGLAVGAGVCVVAMAALSTGVVMARVQPIRFAGEAQLRHTDGPLPRFEVATIKPSSDDGSKGTDLRGPAAMVMHNFTVKDMLQMAYGIRSDNQMEGVSGWMTSQRFDIEAKLSDEEVAAEQKMPFPQRPDRWALMMQALLLDRFHLKTSETTKDAPVYELVVAKGGQKLKPSAVEGDPAKPGRNPLQGRPGKMEGAAIPVSAMTEVLGRQPELGRMVVDKTGLTGLYDWTLTWTPANAEPGTTLPDPNAPGLFAALEEQLGLKLVSAKAPVQVLVVEHVERPTEN